MHPNLARVHRYLLQKPLVGENASARSGWFHVLGGMNLDIVASRESADQPVIKVRLKIDTLSNLGAESSQWQIDEVRSRNWKTVEEGWNWVDLLLDESWSDAALYRLIDESYDLTIQFLKPEYRKMYDRRLRKQKPSVAATLDLTPDFEKITELVVQAVEKYAEKHASSRTAKRHPPATRFDLVFSLGDSESIPWVHVHVDTKPGSNPDGAPTHPDFAKLNCKHWLPAVKAVCDDEAVTVTLNGKRKKCGDEQLTECIGKLLVDVLLKARSAGIFKELPTAERCELGVEDPTTGAFGWPNYDDRGKKNLVG